MNETVSSRPGGSGPVSTLLRVRDPPGGHRSAAAAESRHPLRVRQAMKSVPDGIDASASLDEAEDRMDARGVNWLPVLDAGRLVGLITRLDIRSARSPPATGGSHRGR